MSLLRGNQQPQGPTQMQQPVQKQPETLMQRAIKREKWIVIISAVCAILGAIEHIVLGKFDNIGYVFTAFMFSLVGLTILNFTVIAWMQNIFFRSKQASENFWNQKF